MGPVVLTLAASDASGNGGLQGDLRSIAANGGHAVCVVTAIRARNRAGVLYSEPTSRAMLRAQLGCVLEGERPAAAKVGASMGPEALRLVADKLRSHPPAHVVCDPELLTTDSVAAWREALLPCCNLLVCTNAELAMLNGAVAGAAANNELLARRLVTQGVGAVLLRDTHDVLVRGDGALPLGHAYPAGQGEPAGAGGLFSASVATHLALGRRLEDAIWAAKAYVINELKLMS